MLLRAQMEGCDVVVYTPQGDFRVSRAAIAITAAKAAKRNSVYTLYKIVCMHGMMVVVLFFRKEYKPMMANIDCIRKE